ncbi:conserved hypothetical protein [Trichinella spiralis]|uniref:hypothetical protein n=1 Tax=Trichinella spiralis TaxID=6334 RepID=UPI0001EFC78B|nr:conserved hypothetical protein [Trichinella spiralis]
MLPANCSPSMFLLLAAALGVVLQPQTVICDFEFALIPLMQRAFPGIHIQGCYFHFCQAVLWKSMLLATAFLPPHDVPVAVELLGRDATGSIAALAEWMPPDRLPLWNVYNVNIRTNNDLEDGHFKMNRLAGKRHLGFYELLQLLIDEQGSTETLIQQVTSGRVTASDLQIKNKKYEELQQRITALTAEYSGGTRTLEQFLRAVAYLNTAMNMKTKIPPNSSIGDIYINTIKNAILLQHASEQQPMKFYCEEVGGVRGEIGSTSIKEHDAL